MKKIETAPPIAICATCGCLCSGELVTLDWVFDRIAQAELPVFRHATAGACKRAQERAAAFWAGAQERANAA